MRKLLRHCFTRLLLADEGQALVLTAFGLMMLMLFAALGVDIGYLHYQKEQLQKAADAGAIAAATALSYGDDMAAVQQAAINDVKANGFQNGVNNVVVTVNNPPVEPDPFAGNANYVQVIVTKPIATSFLRVANRNSVNVAGRSVANAAGNASGCIYVMDPAGKGTFTMDGNVTVGTSCGIYVESNDAEALVQNGSSGAITVGGIGGTIGIVGTNPGYKTDGTVVPTPVTNIPIFIDPLATVPQPANPGGCGNAIPHGSMYSPGCYYGISVPANGNYTLMAGTYFLCGGGLSIASTSTLTGSGVTFVLTSCGAGHPYEGITVTGGSSLTLSAPTSGSLKGILFFQDRSVSVGSASSSFDGTSGATFTGALYFPTTDIEFKGTPDFQSQVAIIAWQVEFKGNANIQDNFLPSFGSPIPGAVLVE